jgi:hypothetical protein
LIEMCYCQSVHTIGFIRQHLTHRGVVPIASAWPAAKPAGAFLFSFREI